MRDFIEISIPNKPEYVSVVRLTTSAIASRMGFNIEEIEDIKVAISEIFTNIINNSEKYEVKNQNVEFEIYGDCLNIIFKNPGKGFSHKEMSSENELGLFIVESLMDKVELIENGENIKLMMTKKLGVG